MKSNVDDTVKRVSWFMYKRKYEVDVDIRRVKMKIFGEKALVVDNNRTIRV